MQYQGITLMHFTVALGRKEGRLSIIACHTWTFFLNGVRNSKVSAILMVVYCGTLPSRKPGTKTKCLGWN